MGGSESGIYSWDLRVYVWADFFPFFFFLFGYSFFPSSCQPLAAFSTRLCTSLLKYIPRLLPYIPFIQFRVAQRGYIKLASHLVLFPSPHSPYSYLSFLLLLGSDAGFQQEGWLKEFRKICSLTNEVCYNMSPDRVIYWINMHWAVIKHEGMKCLSAIIGLAIISRLVAFSKLSPFSI